MFNFLTRKFIRDHKNIEDPKVRRNYGSFSGAVGIFVNLILSLSKIVAGAIFHSISVTADGINNMSDAGSSLVTLIGFKMSAKPADKDHPFGHARIEYIAGLILAIIILLVGIELIRSSVIKIMNPRPTNYSSIVFIILIISIIVKLWLSQFYAKIAEIISSSTIKAASVDSRNDVLATSTVLIGALISRFAGYEIDGYMGIAVALFIIYSGTHILKSILDPMLGQMPDRDLVDKIERKILSYDGIISIHDLVIHNYGPNIYFATVDAELDADKNFINAHEIIDLIERDFARDLNINLVIHADPVVTDDEELDSLRTKTEEIVRSIDQRCSIHDFRVLRIETQTNLIFDVVVPSEIDSDAAELVDRIEKAIKAEDPKYYPLITIDENYVVTYVNKIH